MITQIFYNKCGGHSNVWSTTYADSKYSGHTRNHLLSRVKPTERQVRHLHKQREAWVVKL